MMGRNASGQMYSTTYIILSKLIESILRIHMNFMANNSYDSKGHQLISEM